MVRDVWGVLNWLVRVKWRALLNYNKFSDSIQARHFLQNLSAYNIFKNVESNHKVRHRRCVHK